MNEWIDAELALEYGLVNEIVPGGNLMARAWEIAERLASRKKITSRLTTRLLRRPWRQQLLDNLDVGWTSEMWAFLADKPDHKADADAVKIPSDTVKRKHKNRTDSSS